MIVSALLITTLAGILGGSVLAPIKRMNQWPFERSWAIYSVWAYLVAPWLLALLTVPHLFSVYTHISRALPDRPPDGWEQAGPCSRNAPVRNLAIPSNNVSFPHYSEK